MDELIGRIRQALSREDRDPEPFPLLPRDSYSPLPFSSGNFNFLDGKNHPLPDGKTLAFIDGGQAELLSSPDLSVGIIRVCCCAYKNKKRAFSLSSEFYVVITPSRIDDDMGFSVETFPLKGEIFPNKELLALSSSDQTIRSGVRKATPSSLLPVARRFAELELASHAIGRLEKGDMAVLDGTLQENYTNESILLKSLRQKAEEKNISVVAVAKTNSILSRSGASFGAILSHKHPAKEWWYAPLANPKNGAPHLFFAHLHPKAPHVFLMDSFKEPRVEIFTALLSHSNDSVFIGYPYGLVEVDRMARISNQDTSYLQTRLMEKIGRQHLTSLLATKNAHEILDSIRF
ncbi:MAG TPA: DNA double-strand break repair nuclease NurA [Candidatus Nanoarchaeia archaeon]|nr:DNA double-strand break repair nuclease NurA [Candidatus Nanoarchaeia archaeon]